MYEDTIKMLRSLFTVQSIDSNQARQPQRFEKEIIYVISSANLNFRKKRIKNKIKTKLEIG